MSNDSTPAEVVAVLAQLIDVLHTLEEAASGWRKYLIDRGWSDEQAERMAGELLAAFQDSQLIIGLPNRHSVG